jgi:hypothetical protein
MVDGMNGLNGWDGKVSSIKNFLGSIKITPCHFCGGRNLIKLFITVLNLSQKKLTLCVVKESCVFMKK